MSVVNKPKMTPIQGSSSVATTMLTTDQHPYHITTDEDTYVPYILLMRTPTTFTTDINPWIGVEFVDNLHLSISAQPLTLRILTKSLATQKFSDQCVHVPWMEKEGLLGEVTTRLVYYTVTTIDWFHCTA